MPEIQNINGLNRTKSNKLQKQNNQINFTGHRIVEDEKGEKKYKFYLPSAKFSNVKVELVKIEKDANGNITDKSEVTPLGEKQFGKNENFVEVSLGELHIKNLSDKQAQNVVIGYRFVVDGSKYLDTALKAKVGKEAYNIATSPNRTILNKARTMYHVMPASYNPELKVVEVKGIDGKVVKVDISKIRTNHYNKYDAKLQNIIDKISDIKGMGFRRIITTPVFGQDNVSTHGYWTTNPYQVSSSLGNEGDFKNFQLELFKNDMAWVADGAFVNEGLEGIHLKDVLKHGQDSPFTDWFELHNFPNENIKFGVLPLGQKAHENYDVKIINSPLNWSVDKQGMPTANHGKKNPEYNADKPTYIQLFDRRLASKEQIEGQDIIRSYDIKQLENPNEIKTYMDSVQPYHFEVSPKEVMEKFADWKASKDSDAEFKEYLKEWTNFSLAKSSEDGGITLWAGNKDIAKLKFMVTQEKLEKIKNSYKDPEEAQKRIENIKVSTAQVQDNIVQVGKYWTDKTAKVLLTHVAQQLKGSQSPEDFKKAIKNAIDNKQLPESAKGLVDSKYIDHLLSGEYDQSLSKNPGSIEEGLMNYPLDAVEFSPDLTSVLSTPFLKSYASNKEDIGLSRYELMEKDPDNLNVPERFRKEYKNMTAFYKIEMKNVAKKILEKIDETRPEDDKLLENGNLSFVGEGVYRLIADDIAKFVLVKSLDNSFDVNNLDKPEELGKINCKKLGLATDTPEESAVDLLKKLRTGALKINESDITAFAKALASKTEGIDIETVMVAELLVDKTESGLEWRIDAAKDIADMESLTNGKGNPEEIWSEISDFWSKFVSGVKEYNPRAYTIGELTEANEYKGGDKYKTMGDIEGKFLSETNFTTPTNYNYLYSTLHSMFGSFPEKGGMGAGMNMGVDFLNEKFLWAWDGAPGFLFSGPQDSVQFSHVSPGNHDKPRALHGLSLDTAMIYKKEISADSSQNLVDSFGNNSDLSSKLQEINKINQEIDKKLEVAKPILAVFDKTLQNKDWYATDDFKKLEWVAGDRFDGDESSLNTVENSWLYTGDPDFAHHEVDIKELFDNLENVKKSTGKETYQKAFVQLKEQIEPLAKQKANILNDLFEQVSPDALAMGSAIMEGFNVAAKEFNIPKKPFVEAVDKLMTDKNAEFFAMRPFEHNWQDIVKIASEDPEFKASFEKNAKEIEVKAHETFIKPALDRYKEMMKLVVALPGNPTSYAGEELGETGAETKSKNVFRQNRNRLHHEWADKGSDSYRGYIAEYKKELSNILNLRNRKDLSPLVNGATLVLKQHNDGNNKVFGVYRYNDKTDVIALFQNSGFGATRKAADADKTVTLKEVDLGSDLLPSKKGNDSNATENNSYQVGIPFNLGTVEYVDANDESIKYIVKNNKLTRADGKDIEIKGSTLLLKRAEGFDGKPNTISFNGRINKNASVAIANMKYNFAPSHNVSKVQQSVNNKIKLSV